MHKKALNSSKIIMLFIITGVIVGVLIGGFCVVTNTSEETFLTVTSTIIKVCIGLFVLTINILCLCALLRPVFINRIDERGKTTTGVIEDVVVLAHPNQLYVDEWMKKVRYSCTISYEADAKKYLKAFSTTALTSKRELFPLNISKGNNVPIKYCRRFPGMSIIDVDILKRSLKSEQKRYRVFFMIIPIVVTTFYIVSIV